MSFENKGFKNDLNDFYEGLNNQPLKYKGANYSNSAMKLNAVGLPDYNNFSIKDLGAKAVGKVEDKNINLPAINQPAFIKTDLPEFVVNAPAKKKSKTIYYILSALILAVAIYFIYTYIAKKK
jgi:hypothetical protein